MAIFHLILKHNFVLVNKKLYLFAKKFSMIFRFFLCATLFFMLLTSCVPTKDLIYLQDKSKSTSPIAVKQVVLKPYRLQTNDILTITIKAIDPKLVSIFNPVAEAGGGGGGQTGSGAYFNGFTVDDHGNIRFPILGEINVLGYTVEETREKIEKELLRVYFKSEANIFVNVKLSGLRFTINGEIGSPGTKTLFQDKVNILEAIANSGDITVVGDRKNVSVIRQYNHGVEIHDIDLTDIKVMESPYFFVQPNDYIYIKPLKQKTWGTGKTGIESLGTILTFFSIGLTTFFLLRN
jgi:polysaccharide export outer membrane protein